MSKVYYYENYDRISKAIKDCGQHQDWNVINIYPTGWRQEVCVVYYIEK